MCVGRKRGSSVRTDAAFGVGWALGGVCSVRRGLGAGAQARGDVGAVDGRSPVAQAQQTQFYFDLHEGTRRVRRTGALSGRRPRTGRPDARLAIF